MAGYDYSFPSQSPSTAAAAGPHFDSAYLPPFALPFYDDQPTPHIPSYPGPSQFDLTSLPFSGLDFLQSFTNLPAAQSEGMQGVEQAEQAAQDALWASLGASSPFRMGSDIPFSFADGPGN